MRTFQDAFDVFRFPDYYRKFYCNSNDDTGPGTPLASLVPGILGIGGSHASAASAAVVAVNSLRGVVAGSGGGVGAGGASTPRLKDEPLRCCDSNLNFATVHCSEDDSEYGQYKKNKVSRQDPMSHRIIEKRRRDRMNNCLADLSRLIPADYLKKGRGRIEKTEIIEMAIKHIKYLQQIHRAVGKDENNRGFNNEQYRLGYQECMSETMRFLVEVEGYFAREAFCVRLINHLQKHCEDLLQERIPTSNKKQNKEKDYVHLQQSVLNNNINTNQQINNNNASNNNTNPTIRLISSPNHNNGYEHNLKDIANREVKNEIQEPSDLRLYPNEKNYENGLESKKEDFKLVENNREHHNSLYKFKNKIKQRFTQDLSAETNQLKVFKRRKLSEPIRRTSICLEVPWGSENHSSPNGSSQCSPPSSEFRISSESESRISPTGSSVSDNRNGRPSSQYNLKSDMKSSLYDRYSPLNNKFPIKNLPIQSDVEKSNFGVPIFALHAKGSFYIPLTIDYNTLMPFLQHHNLLDVLPNVHNIILHPVTINVNFQTNYFNSILSGSVRSINKKIETHNGWT